MSGNGKIMCNHGVNLFKCQTCIDALVAEQIEKQEQRIKALEQQLKAAKESYTDIGNYDLAMPDDIKGRFQTELFYRGAYAMRDKIIQEYTNSLEGERDEKIS